MMYLNNRQVIQLLIPFLLAAILLYFKDEVLMYISPKLPSYANHNDNLMTKKIDEYLGISQDMKIYDDIIKKIQQRKKAVTWISKEVLYKKQNLQSDEKNKIKKQKQVWKLEAVFPKYNRAIINSKLVHSDSVVNEAKVLKIEFDKVLIKTEKGLKWIHLFH